jgi:hypothetical protein
MKKGEPQGYTRAEPPGMVLILPPRHDPYTGTSAESLNYHLGMILIPSAESSNSYQGMILILVRVQGFLPRHDPNTGHGPGFLTTEYCDLGMDQGFLPRHDPNTVCDLGMDQGFLPRHDPNTSAESKFSYRGMIRIL